MLFDCCVQLICNIVFICHQFETTDGVDKALYYYYKHMNKDYDLKNGKFKQFVIDNGFEEYNIDEDLAKNGGADNF